MLSQWLKNTVNTVKGTLAYWWVKDTLTALIMADSIEIVWFDISVLCVRGVIKRVWCSHLYTWYNRVAIGFLAPSSISSHMSHKQLVSDMLDNCIRENGSIPRNESVQDVRYSYAILMIMLIDIEYHLLRYSIMCTQA